MSNLNVTLNLPATIFAHLEREAQQRNLPIDDIISEVLADYFDDPTETEILDGLKRSLQQAVAGQTRPAHDFLDELDADTNDDNTR